MIDPKDELFHINSNANFIDIYRISTINKRDKWYSFVYLTWHPHIKEIGIHSFFNFLDFSTAYSESIKETEPKKSIGTSKCKYTILQPLEESKLTYKENNFSTSIIISDPFPYYEFVHNKTSPSNAIEHLFESYCTRCKAKVSVERYINSKLTNKNLDCICFKEHSWGLYPFQTISCDSRIVIHFREQSISLRYIEYDGITHSYGCILRKSGNIAIVLVELEFLSIKNNVLESSEFTYKDAQDDIDLIVSKPIKTHYIDVPKKVKSTHTHIVSFSDFTIIGSNKKGYGFEEHYISFDRLNKLL